MTTIQDRIEKFNFEYKKKFPNTMMLVVSENEQHHKDIEIEKEVLEFWNNKLIQSIKEVEEETKGDILNNLHAFVCDLATDKGKNLAKEDCLELIRYQIERIYGKKLLSINSKEKQK